MRILVMGKFSEKFWAEASRHFLDKLKHYMSLEIIELELPRAKRTTNSELNKKEEAQLFLKHLKPGDSFFLTDENGKEMSSRKFAHWMEQYYVQSRGPLTLLIGGAFGYDEELKNKASGLLSFSQLTMNHQIFRVVLLEQIYRACTILKGEPYHHD